jgi:hypothetical protein
MAQFQEGSEFGSTQKGEEARARDCSTNRLENNKNRGGVGTKML